MKVLGFGEVLWDEIEGERYIGGASFNFTAHSRKLGADSYLFSSVGNDVIGKKTLDIVKEKDVKADFIKIVSKPTCVVKVLLNENGLPRYTFPKLVSWDYIEIDESDITCINKLNFDYFYFGTLEQRSATSFKTLKTIFNRCRFKSIFFDMNLRSTYYSKDKIEYAFEKCNILKISDEEVKKINKLLKFNVSEYKKLANIILKEFDIEIICITAGENGAYISNKKDFIYCPGYKIVVKDTIGSGDAFSAALITQLYKGIDIKNSCDFANKIDAIVASLDGAIPDYSIKDYF